MENNDSIAASCGSYTGPGCSALPPVLDACCGGRMMWFNKKDPRCMYVDKRCESFHVGPGPNDLFNVQPDQVCDFTALPFPDETFAHVVFDPPHVIREEAKGWITRKYGVLNGDWRGMLRKGFAECFRVLRPEGVLVFKWSDSNVKVREILALTPVSPLYGHKTTEHTNTHWIAFLKPSGCSTSLRAVLEAIKADYEFCKDKPEFGDRAAAYYETVCAALQQNPGADRCPTERENANG